MASKAGLLTETLFFATHFRAAFVVSAALSLGPVWEKVFSSTLFCFRLAFVTSGSKSCSTSKAVALIGLVHPESGTEAPALPRYPVVTSC